MRKIILLPVLALAIFLVGSTAYAGRQDFILVNRCGQAITEIYCSATDNWEENVLGGTILYNDETFQLNFPADQTARYWDLKIVFEDGQELYWGSLDLFSISEMTLDSNGAIHTQ
ncbi:MAG: hypothetical protein J5809_03390 [Selenomonadaceae bacterium]|nr:hypothetical protein [Selenomonadaceae bacterium]